MMNSPTAKKVLGAIVAAVTLTMVTSVAPASAAQAKDSDRSVSIMKKDTGWD